MFTSQGPGGTKHPVCCHLGIVTGMDTGMDAERPLLSGLLGAASLSRFQWVSKGTETSAGASV